MISDACYKELFFLHLRLQLRAATHQQKSEKGGATAKIDQYIMGKGRSVRCANCRCCWLPSCLLHDRFVDGKRPRLLR